MRKVFSIHRKKELNKSEKATGITKDEETFSKDSSEKFLRSDQ
jgi:hypothetical protein